jgi:branched-subunit amino acid aminotransferase/4-amino-4-deoxychorismate lyase
MNEAGPAFVHVNGRVVPAARARISVFDRGLLYGDGVFETLRAYRGRPFALATHLARMRASSRFLGIRLPRRDWRADVGDVLARNRLLSTDAWVRITLTRGVAAPALLPPERIQPTVIIICGRLSAAIDRAQRRGTPVTFLPFGRHGFLAEHKALDYLPAVLGKAMAVRRHAFEGLYVDADGSVTEGTTTNLFVCRRNWLVTPPTAGVLPGVTRRLVIRLAAADGLRVTERRLTPNEVAAADEAFLTSSLAEIVPIISVDDRPIGGGQPGRRTQRLQHLYRQMVDQTLARQSSY